MKRLLNILITLILVLGNGIYSHAAKSATSILDNTAKTFTSPASVTVKFSLSGATSGMGQMTMSKQKFTFSAGDMSVWYDGKSQWALQRSAGEVNLTNPTADELAESNPFAILSAYRSLYNAKLISSTKTAYTIELTAKHRHSQIKKAILTISPNKYQLMSIKATLSDNSTLSVKVTSFSPGKALPASYFQYNAHSNPSVKIIDLR
ncbi:MAG: outer-membrane lipoprotein carrier protein LolA [Muribaculaceae bacterium]|nr:outer-membrane lipoprotein carrier protein LolA [Muribaculaceae bacterium]